MSIKNKMLFAIISAIIFSIGGVLIGVSLELRSVFVKNFTVVSKAQLEQLNNFVTIFFDDAQTNIELLAESQIVRETAGNFTVYVDKTEAYEPTGDTLVGNERLVFDELERLVTKYEAYDLLYIGDANEGFVQFPSDALPPHFTPLARPWYKDVLKARTSLVTEGYLSDTGTPVTTIAVPVLGKKQEIIGVAGLDINLATLTEVTGSVRLGKTGYVMIVDSNNQVLSDPAGKTAVVNDTDKNTVAVKHESWLGKALKGNANDDFAPLHAEADTALSAILKTKPNETAEVEFDGVVWLAQRYKTNAGWNLIVVQQKDEVFNAAFDVTKTILYVGVFLLIAMTIVALFIASSIAKPIGLLVKAAESVAQGNLAAIPQDASPFKAELRQLHSSLQAMVAKLSDLISVANVKIKESEEALALSRKSMAEADVARRQAEKSRQEGVLYMADQLSGVLVEINTAVRVLAKEAEETHSLTVGQQHRVATTASGMEQVNTTAGEVARSAARTSDFAEKSRQEVHLGHELVGRVLVSMNRIEQQSLDMSATIAGLGKQAEDIGEVMSIIGDIADQTNLLALNAAIEAARAGEYGRGFAVVADEVRKLAEKTMIATKEVGDAILAIQNSTDSNMKSMQKSAAFISESAQITQNAGEALNRIEEAVSRTADEIRTIAAASEEQTSIAEEVVRSSDEVNTLAGKVLNATSRSNKATDDLEVMVGKLQGIVNSLRNG